MRLKHIASKIFDQLKYNGTTIMLSDYESRLLLVEAVAYTFNEKGIFEVKRSDKIGQDFIINIPKSIENLDGGDKNTANDIIDCLFEVCADKKIKVIALSLGDIYSETIVSPETSLSFINHIFRRICENLKLDVIIICSKELENINTLREAISSLTATMKLDEKGIYKMIHSPGMAPSEVDKDGRIKITSNRRIIRAGEFTTWTYKYTVGRLFVKNAELAFAIIHPSNWMIPQFAVMDAPGYTTVRTNGDARILAHRQPACGNKGFIIQFKVIEGELRRGEYIEITLGDTSLGSPGMKTQSVSMDKQVIKVMGDFEDAVKIPWQHNDFTYGLKPIPAFRVMSGKPKKFDLICPTNVVKNKNFKGIVRICDSVGNLCTKNTFEGFLAINDNELLPLNITPEDNSHIAIRNLKLKRAGVHRIVILNRNKKAVGTGNPIICTEHSPKYKMYWGDLHMHSNLSDGIGDPDYIYYSAKNIAGLDIAALGDHDAIMGANEESWEKTIDLTKKWHKEGEFITLLGYEFTERKYGGDRNVYYLNDTGPLINSDYDKVHPDELYEKLRKLKFKSMVIPHGVIGKGAWEYSDPRFCRLAEIYSTHGSSEAYPCEHYYAPDYANYDVYAPESSYLDSFSYGLKIGVIGGTDDHGGQPGWGYSWHNYRGGIMGVLMENLSRDCLWDALWERRVIATTGERIYLNMTVNSLVVGNEDCINDKPEIKIEALGTDKIDMIELLRNEEIIHCFHGNSGDEECIYIDNKWDGKETWYRCRLTQADGERAWTSPIWITRRDGSDCPDSFSVGDHKVVHDAIVDPEHKKKKAYQ